MKKLGLVGGMGPESTVPYYKGIVFGVQKALGRPCFPRLTVESVDVFRMLEMLSAERYDEITDYLHDAIKSLAAAGADFIALSANTAHVVFDRLRERSPVPLLSIVEAAKDEALARGYGKAGLLGTKFTMQGEFFRQPFEQAGVRVVIPDDSEIDTLSDKIYNELELGIVRPATLSLFQDAVARMRDREGIEAVILGCTELPLMLNDGNCPVPVLDTMRIHIDAIVCEILS